MRFHPQYLAAAKACPPVLPGVLAFAAISGVAMVAAGIVAGMLALHFFDYLIK